MKQSKSSVSIKLNTEKALRAIDQYEKAQHQRIRMITTHNILQSVSKVDVIYRQFIPKEIVRMQLLPNSMVYYRLKLNKNVEPKIIIRNFSGGPGQLYVNFQKLPRDLEKAVYHFYLKDDVIIKLDANTVQNGKLIFLVFKSNKNLTMFNFRMDTIRQKKTKETIRNHSLNASVVSIQQNTKSPDQKQKIRLRRLRSARRIKSVESEDLQANKPEIKKKKMEKLKLIEKEKKQATKKRVENAQVFKQKDAEARIICAKCKSLVSEFDQLVEQQKNIQAALIKKIAPLFFMIKFGLISANVSHQREKNNEKVFMIRHYAKKFEKKIRVSYRQTRKMIPSHQTRELQGFNQQITLFSNVLHKKQHDSAVKTIVDVLQNCSLGLIINKGMKQASKYRRYVRELQRKWKSKYENRMKLLMMYCQKQMEITIKNYEQLKVVQPLFVEKNAARIICEQYQKDVAGKLKEYRDNYLAKLDEIQQYKRLNQEIIQHNKVALRKHKKQLLEIPKKPSYPMHRFFRDLNVLRTLVRGWLEVEYRRWKKLNPNPQINKQLGKKQKDRVKKG